MNSVYSRIYQHLQDLLPDLENQTVGASFYAPPRLPGDWSLYCGITTNAGSVMEIEIAHDQTMHGLDQAAPWMVFKVDHASKTAELLKFQDERSYETVRPCDGVHAGKRSNLNMFAANWLHVLMGMAFMFQPVANADVNFLEKA
jgi:uncharacterized protein YqiB (DUF1249 family)